MERWDVDVSSDLEGVEPGIGVEIEAAARMVLREERAGEVSLSIALVADEEIARLNEEYLSHVGPTDVIAFPLAQDPLPLLGDIYIGYEQARRQAEELGVSLREELLRLAIHGTLHVLGWDHPEADRAGSRMYVRQEELLKRALGAEGPLEC